MLLLINNGLQVNINIPVFYLLKPASFKTGKCGTVTDILLCTYRPDFIQELRTTFVKDDPDYYVQYLAVFCCFFLLPYLNPLSLHNQSVRFRIIVANHI